MNIANRFSGVAASILMLFVLASCSGGESENGGDANDICSAAKVVNGTECDVNWRTPIVRYFISNLGLCSGAMIAPDKVLTAAHCILDGVPASEFILVGESFDDIIAVGKSVAVAPGFAAARRELENSESPDVTEQAAIEAESKRYFSSHSLPDIAIITLDHPLTRRTLPVAQSYFPQVGDGFRSFGYGQHSIDDESFPNNPDVASLSTLLTGKTNFISKFLTQGLCHGDSGGPTVIQFGDGEDVITGVADAIATATLEDECSPDNLLLYSSTAANIGFLKRAAPDADYR